jgi:hypothetical protein
MLVACTGVLPSVAVYVGGRGDCLDGPNRLDLGTVYLNLAGPKGLL